MSGGREIKQFYRKFKNWLSNQFAYITAFTLIALLLLAFLWPSIFIFVHSGEAGVLYKRFAGGTVTNKVYPEGLTIIWPWDKMYIYNVRIQAIARDFKVLTTKGLPITIKMVIRYYPEYDMVGVLHQRVGPDYVESIVIPQIESVLRKTIGQYSPEEIYTTKRGVLKTIILEALEETGQNSVIIDDVLISGLELPPAIQDAIEEKLILEQQMHAYVFKLKKEEKEADRKRIEATGIRDYQKIISTTINDRFVRWKGVQATLDLAKSPNTKIVIIGAGKEGLPVILGGLSDK